ncbi:MAG: hypothetical protein P1V36_07030 [Planctomycetota bacterium]|nr:hypothetical protein [Planctomycetota bacterium]
MSDFVAQQWPEPLEPALANNAPLQGRAPPGRAWKILLGLLLTVVVFFLLALTFLPAGLG